MNKAIKEQVDRMIGAVGYVVKRGVVVELWGMWLKEVW